MAVLAGPSLWACPKPQFWPRGLAAFLRPNPGHCKPVTYKTQNLYSVNTPRTIIRPATYTLRTGGKGNLAPDIFFSGPKLLDGADHYFERFAFCCPEKHKDHRTKTTTKRKATKRGGENRSILKAITANGPYNRQLRVNMRYFSVKN